MKIGDVVSIDNGEIVKGEIVKIRKMINGATLQEQFLVTIQTEKGFRSIYLDNRNVMEFAK